ncbi:MAG: hypothetical protein IT355_13270 [Gemmatimonadaceae bacterium]|nr:hypothetical protein [Gemmatimonadaceae bacterium]
MSQVNTEIGDPSSRWIMRTINGPDGLRAVAVTRNGSSSFVIKCDNAGPNSIYIDVLTSPPFGGNFDKRRLDFSFDAEPLKESAWTYWEEHVVLFDAGAYLERLATAGRASFRAYRADGAAVDLVFDVAGADLAIKYVAEVCLSDPIAENDPIFATVSLEQLNRVRAAGD